jgi:hypothetical protein
MKHCAIGKCASMHSVSTTRHQGYNFVSFPWRKSVNGRTSIDVNADGILLAE